MNFLAHAVLSGDDEKLLLGNFVADFVKGKAALGSFEQDVVNGILLHRAIDAYTDSHPLVTESKNRLRPKYRHYAGVIVDVYYDHLLARHFNAFHPAALKDFADKVYGIVEKYFSIVPSAVQEFFPYMKRGDWLYSYATREGIARALSGMSRRTPYRSRMDEAIDDLTLHDLEFEGEFLQFFPELERHVRNYLEQKTFEI